MLYTTAVALLSFTTSSRAAEFVRPQAIGIDISTQFIHATQYSAIANEFTSLATLQCSAELSSLVHQLYQRRELRNKLWHKDYQEYEKWKSVRKLLQITSLDSWVADWAPQLSIEYRYHFNTDLDTPIEDPTKNPTWFDRLKSSLLGQTSADYPTAVQTQGNSSLNNANFVNIFALALEALKTEVLATHNLTITSAVIAKSWIFDDLNNLLEQACLKADIEVLDNLDRADAARVIVSKADKSKALVIEQWEHGCMMYRPSESMSCDELSAAWVPHNLLYKMLDSIGFEPNGTEESQTQLLHEIIRTRAHMTWVYGNDREQFDKEETTIVIPNFGTPNFTFEQTLSGADISGVEAAYIEWMQLEIESMLLSSEIYSFMKDNDLTDKLDRNGTIELAKTTSHPEAASGGSWWNEIDAVLVIANFPELRLIQLAATRAIASIRDGECGNIFLEDFVQYDTVSRGAALHADDLVAQWDIEERWRKCAEIVEDDGYYQCMDAEKNKRCKEAESFYDCWYDEEHRRDMVHEEL